MDTNPSILYDVPIQDPQYADMFVMRFAETMRKCSLLNEPVIHICE
jgi:hypothetical protein